MSSFPLSHFCLQRPSQRLSDLRHFPFLLCIWVTCFRAHLSLRWVGCPLFPSLFPSASAWPAVYFLLSVFPPCSTVSGSWDGTFWWLMFERSALFWDQQSSQVFAGKNLGLELSRWPLFLGGRPINPRLFPVHGYCPWGAHRVESCFLVATATSCKYTDLCGFSCLALAFSATLCPIFHCHK